MTGVLLGFGLWLRAYVGVGLFLVRKGQLLIGGVILFLISFGPLIFGRSTTPPDWHDSPLMGLYYLPTFLAAFFALILVAVGLFRSARKALRTQAGTR